MASVARSATPVARRAGAGNRTKEEIDRQVRDERNPWRD